MTGCYARCALAALLAALGAAGADPTEPGLPGEDTTCLLQSGLHVSAMQELLGAADGHGAAVREQNATADGPPPAPAGPGAGVGTPSTRSAERGQLQGPRRRGGGDTPAIGVGPASAGQPRIARLAHGLAARYSPRSYAPSLRWPVPLRIMLLVALLSWAHRSTSPPPAKAPKAHGEPGWSAAGYLQACLFHGLNSALALLGFVAVSATMLLFLLIPFILISSEVNSWVEDVEVNPYHPVDTTEKPWAHRGPLAVVMSASVAVLLLAPLALWPIVNCLANTDMKLTAWLQHQRHVRHSWPQSRRSTLDLAAALIGDWKMWRNLLYFLVEKLPVALLHLSAVSALHALSLACVLASVVGATSDPPGGGEEPALLNFALVGTSFFLMLAGVGLARVTLPATEDLARRSAAWNATRVDFKW